jgi:diguanylate cyclase (GGDEF)-like protein
MQTATLTSTPELASLLEQALRCAHEDARLPELTDQIKVLAEASGDLEALFQGRWLLAQHQMAGREYMNVLGTLEPLLEVPFVLAAERRASVLALLTKACDATEEVSKTLQYGSEALGYYREHQGLEQLAAVHSYLGNAFTFLCSFHEALELCRTLNNLAGLANSYVDIAWTYCQHGQNTKAESYLLKALDIAHETQNWALEARSLGNLANTYGNLGNHQLALEYHQKVTGLYEEMGHMHSAMVGYANIGFSLMSLGRSAEAFPYMHKAFVQLERAPNRGFEGWLSTKMGELLLETDPDQAIGYFEKGLSDLKAVGSLEGVADAHHKLSALYEQRDLPKALEHHKAYAELEIKTLKDMNEKRTQALTVQFEVARLEQERRTYQSKNMELLHANEHLERLSLRDGLTGVYNRRHLDNTLQRVFLEAQSLGKPFTVIISDIDDFKRVNDVFSHTVGDDVLKTVAAILETNTRSEDLVARFGGEEFVVVLQDVSHQQAALIAEQLRQKIEAHPWDRLHPDLSITLSLGLCSDTALEGPERMLAAADDRLYIAKGNGKNRVQA